MKEFKGLPAPWATVDNGGFIEIKPDSLTEHSFAYVFPNKFIKIDKEVQVANAALIAAAPELLAFAMDFIDKVESGRAKSIDSYNKAKVAVSKALGNPTPQLTA